MIHITADDYCLNCDKRELEISDIFEKFDENGEMVTSQDIRCVHEEACERAFRLLRSQIKQL